MAIIAPDLNKFLKPWYSFLKENQVEELRQELTCSICLDLHKDPVITNCLHIFCKICLETSFIRSDKCPLCRREITKHESPTSPAMLVIIKKALGLGCSLTAIDALKTPEEKSQYEKCRSKVQEHIMKSAYFGGPWCIELPGDFYESVIFRLRHQLEIRGFDLYSLFTQEGKTYCRVIRAGAGTISASDELVGWDPKFTAQKVFEEGKAKYELERTNIMNSDPSDTEKLKQVLMSALRRS